jgi:hypothetical protein
MSEEVVEVMVDTPKVDGALTVSFGSVQPGREELAVELFTELSRFLGNLLAEDEIIAFRPYFYADGLTGGDIGFFLVEGRRNELDALRRREEFVRLILRMGAATANVRVHTLMAGSQAGRLVHLYDQVRRELGLLGPSPGLT